MDAAAKLRWSFLTKKLMRDWRRADPSATKLRSAEFMHWATQSPECQALYAEWAALDAVVMDEEDYDELGIRRR